MVGLTLREELRGRRLKGTQIELPQAIKMAAADFLRITYPSGDVLKAVEAIGPNQGRPVVLIGAPRQPASTAVGRRSIWTCGQRSRCWGRATD